MSRQTALLPVVLALRFTRHAMTQQPSIWGIRNIAIAGGHEALQLNGATSALTVVILLKKIARWRAIPVLESHLLAPDEDLDMPLQWSYEIQVFNGIFRQHTQHVSSAYTALVVDSTEKKHKHTYGSSTGSCNLPLT